MAESMPVAAHGLSAEAAAVPRSRYLLSSLTGALSTALVPLVPFLAFDSSQSGTFTIIYTCFLVTWSAALSCACDVMLRISTAAHPVDRRDFTAAVSWVALIGGLLACIVAALLTGDAVIWVCAGVAVFAGVFRGAIRYAWVMHGRIGWRVFVSDFVAAVVFITVVIEVIFDATRDDALQKVLAGWALANVAGLGVFLPISLGGPRRALRWGRQHRRVILPLLGDTALYDTGGSLAPITLLIWLPLSQFGIYRATGSVGSPVQILLDPVRPRISRLSSRTVVRLPWVLMLGIFAGALAGAAYVLLHVIAALQLFPASVLGDVAAHALQAAFYVFGNAVSYFAYLVARGQFSGRRLLAGRLTETALQFLLPLAGVLIGGLNGALTGFAAAAVTMSGIWLVLHATNGASATARPDARWAPTQQTVSRET